VVSKIGVCMYMCAEAAPEVSSYMFLEPPPLPHPPPSPTPPFPPPPPPPPMKTMLILQITSLFLCLEIFIGLDGV
jgi:hypothetical protein